MNCIRPELVWDGAALRQLLDRSFGHGEVIAVSCRQPYAHQWVDGKVVMVPAASGVVTAIEPVLRACGGTWIAHGDGAADRGFVDDCDGLDVDRPDGQYRLRRIWLSDAERHSHSDRLSNSGLWPLCHATAVKPSFQTADWQQYCAVNQRFADAVVEEAHCANPVVLLQDYQLALVPRLLRSRLPRATIVSFWHIPWASADRMVALPWLQQLLDGLLGSDIIGVQTSRHGHNLLASARAAFGTAASVDGARICWRGLCSVVRPYPVSIAWPETTAAEAVLAYRWQPAALRLGLPKGGRLVLSIDRFDYTKGLIERLQAIEALLDSYVEWRQRLRFVQIASPTRHGIDEYADYQARVLSETERINARFAIDGVGPIELLTERLDHDVLTALYRAADVFVVSSLDDGMNLVCKEYVAARNDEQGVLMLSRHAGAAEELREAVIVDSRDIDQVKQALHRALSMSAAEQRGRMRALRSTVRRANVYRWVANQLLDAAALRASSGAMDA